MACVTYLIRFGGAFGHNLWLIFERWIVMTQYGLEFNEFLVFGVTVAVAVLADGLVNIPVFVTHSKVVVALLLARQLRYNPHAFLGSDRPSLGQVLLSLFAYVPALKERDPLLLYIGDPVGNRNVLRRLRCLNHFLFEREQLARRRFRLFDFELRPFDTIRCCLNQFLTLGRVEMKSYEL